MSDLLRREDAIEILSERAESLRGMQGDLGGACRGAMRIIESLPSAEPERKKGWWEVQPSINGDRPFIWWKCSVCGNVIYSETERDRREFHAFCGRCGAEMFDTMFIEKD